MAEITICSARNLKRWSRGANCCSDHPFRPFAVAYLDNNEMFSTEVDEKGDRCPKWDATGSFSVGPINDDTTLNVVIYDARKDGTNKKIGSASRKLKELVNDVRCDQLPNRSLQLKRFSGRSRGYVNVEVLITEPGTAQPDGRPPKKTKKTKELCKGLIRGLQAANVLRDTVEDVEDGMEILLG